jgi:hypothetical protein
MSGRGLSSLPLQMVYNKEKSKISGFFFGYIEQRASEIPRRVSFAMDLGR